MNADYQDFKYKELIIICGYRPALARRLCSALRLTKAKSGPGVWARAKICVL